MDGLEALTLAIAGIITLITGVGGYLLSRLRSLEAKQDQRYATDLATARTEKIEAEKERDHLRTINLELQERVAGLEKRTEKVPDLENQVATLCRQLEAVQERLETAEARATNKQAEIERLTAQIETLKQQNHALFEANKALQVERKTFERVLILLGIKLAEPGESAPAAPEPGEQKDGVPEVEKTEPTSIKEGNNG